MKSLQSFIQLSVLLLYRRHRSVGHTVYRHTRVLLKSPKPEHPILQLETQDVYNNKKVLPFTKQRIQILIFQPIIVYLTSYTALAIQ